MNEIVIQQKDIIQLDKKSLQELGEAEAKRLTDEGFHDASQLMVFARKYTEFLTSFNNALKSSTIDALTQNNNKLEVLGSKLTLVNGATYYNYNDDTTYADLEKQLSQRKDLLKTALKMDGHIVDSDGAVVPKVSIKRHGADMIKVTL